MNTGTLVKTIFAVSIILIGSIKGSGQKVKPVIQTGHSDYIQFYDISPENGILLTADDRDAFLWNFRTGLQLRSLTLPFRVRGATFCASGTEVALMGYTYGQDASVRFFRAADGEPLETIFLFEDYDWGRKWKTLDKMWRNQDGSRLALRYFDGMDLIDVNGRKLITSFELPDYKTIISFTETEHEFLIAWPEEEDSRIAVIDTNGRVLKDTSLQPHVPLFLIPQTSYDKYYLLFEDGAILSVNKELDFSPVPKLPFDEKPSDDDKIALAADGESLYLTRGGKLFYYDARAAKWSCPDTAGVNHIDGILALPPPGQKVVKVMDEYAMIGRPEPAADDILLYSKSYRPRNPAISAGGIFLSESSDAYYSETRMADLRTGKMLMIPTGFSINQWITDSVALLASTGNYEEPESNGLYIRNIFTGASSFFHKFPEDQVGQGHSVYSKGVVANLDQYGKKLFIATGKNFEKRKTISVPATLLSNQVFISNSGRFIALGSETIRIYDINKGKWIVVPDTSRSTYFDNFCFTPDSKAIIYSNFNTDYKTQIKVYNIETGEITVRLTRDSLISDIACHPELPLYAIGFMGGNVELRNLDSDDLISSYHQHSGPFWKMFFVPARNWLVTSGWDNQIILYDHDKSSLVTKMAGFYSNDEFGFALIHPDNYYTVSPNLISKLHYAGGYNTYSFAQFDLQLNRPDIVLREIGLAETQLLEMYEKAYQRRLVKAGVDEDGFTGFESLEPLIIANRSVSGSVVTQGLLHLEASTSRDANKVNTLVAYVNGQQIQEWPGASNKWNIELELGAGINSIELAYKTPAGVESLREMVVVEYKPDEPVVSRTWYIGIGVSRYLDSTQNLRYAVKDVTDIAERFRNHDSTAGVLLFTDQEVTRGIIDSLERFLAATSIDDKVIMSLSGHGLLDTAGNFYFATHDIDFSDPASRGISYDDIAGMFSKVPARKKLVMIDACHSGELDEKPDFIVRSEAADTSDGSLKVYKPRSSIKRPAKRKLKNTVQVMQEYFSDISKDNGLNVISAAAGEEYALEGHQWQNGVFSYCFIKGYFEGAADNDYNDRISQSELRKYMQEQVMLLTSGRQRPTSRSTNTEFDWEF